MRGLQALQLHLVQPALPRLLVVPFVPDGRALQQPAESHYRGARLPLAYGSRSGARAGVSGGGHCEERCESGSHRTQHATMAEKAFAAASARAWSSTLRSAGVPESSWGARCRSLGADPLKPRPASTTSPAAQLHQRRLTLPMATKRWLSRSSARTSPRAVVAGLTRHLANRALRASLLSQRPSHSSRSFISPRRQARRLPTTWQLVSGYLLEPRSRDETRSASVPAIHHAFG